MSHVSYIHTCICTTCMYVGTLFVHGCMLVCMYACMYVCLYVFVGLLCSKCNQNISFLVLLGLGTQIRIYI